MDYLLSFSLLTNAITLTPVQTDWTSFLGNHHQHGSNSIRLTVGHRIGNSLHFHIFHTLQILLLQNTPNLKS
jgi:hypothetical protein